MTYYDKEMQDKPNDTHDKEMQDKPNDTLLTLFFQIFQWRK